MYNISLRPCFQSFGYAPRSGIGGSYGCSVFNFLMNCHILFHSGGTILHSHQKHIGGPISPHPHWHLRISFFLSFIFDSSRPNGYEEVSHCSFTNVFKKYVFIFLVGPVLSWSIRTVSCGKWDLVPWLGIEAGPLQWEGRVSATGLSGKPPCSFDLHFLKGLWWWACFIAYWPFVYLLWWNIYSVPLPILNWVIWFFGVEF